MGTILPARSIPVCLWGSLGPCQVPGEGAGVTGDAVNPSWGHRAWWGHGIATAALLCPALGTAPTYPLCVPSGCRLGILLKAAELQAFQGGPHCWVAIASPARASRAPCPCFWVTGDRVGFAGSLCSARCPVPRVWDTAPVLQLGGISSVLVAEHTTGPPEVPYSSHMPAL